MKALVTGGTGFIGQHTLRRLAQTDHQVVCLVRPGSEPKLLNSRLMRPWPNLQIVNGDGAPDAYWDNNLTLRRMDDNNRADNPRYARSWNWGGLIYWAVREGQGQIGWPGQ